MKRSISFIILISVLLTTLAPFVVAVDAEPIVTETSIDVCEFNRIHEELSSVIAEIRELQKQGNTTSMEYQELRMNHQDLIQQLDDIGAVIDTATLTQLPAPSSQPNMRTLPDNLADLEEYYNEWFVFSGYEETISYIGRTYRAYIVTVTERDTGNSDENSLLFTTEGGFSIIKENEYIDANTFTELMSTAFQFSADCISGALELTPLETAVLSTAFSAFVTAANSGTIVIKGKQAYSTLILDATTSLKYTYVWDDTNDEWVYCLSSSRVKVNAHVYLYYYEKINGVYELMNTKKKYSYSLLGYPLSELGSAAVSLYVSNNHNAPTYNVCYQPSVFKVDRKLFGRGNFKNLTEFPLVSCERPGDLWQLGSY